LRRFESIPPAGRGRVVAARQLPPRYGDQSPSLAGRPDPNPYRGQAGESIHIQASDDFQIADVEVSITDASGAVLERGAATPLGDGAGWNYITTTSLPPDQTVSIEATATDHPGHKGSKTRVAGTLLA